MAGDSVILSVEPLGFPWRTVDPFLFCAHHDDAYPAGNDEMGPAAALVGRNIGSDFSGRDGWSMYHGDVVPGFPRHPHRGFETVTLARRGFIDHSDSLGATARFGQGDCQWMTAGRGVVHSEMFPLRSREHNHTELFQIWLNLPRASKMVPPHFKMFWGAEIPHFEVDNGRVAVDVVAGHLLGARPPSPPPDSWAANPDAHVTIALICLAADSQWTVPKPPDEGVNRTLYFFRGPACSVAGTKLSRPSMIKLRSDADIGLESAGGIVEMLLLEGRPIGEPVSQHGPFVMNRPEEIYQAIADYQRTEFGGWPWPGDGPVHPRERGRFAIHADGTIEEPG